LAGIYLHIPFCKQRCNYCDFYKEISLEHTDRFTEALITELRLRAKYLNGASVHTIYFGGGTPSVLSNDQFQRIFSALFSFFTIENDAEITLEANPDDLSPSYLKVLKDLPFNRISMGIQSFSDVELKAVNRRHSAQQAIQSVTDARSAGFRNISIDLIYGLPGQSMEQWEQNLICAFELKPEHISAYGLTYEEGTGLWKQRAKGLIKETPDEVMLQMYRHMLLQMKIKGYDAYEISNFALPGFRSKHNSAYWDLTPYLGVGPSAHSFDGVSRQWNISHLVRYMEGIEKEELAFEYEILTEQDSYNDYIMVRLRTRAGISYSYIDQYFGHEMLSWCKSQSVSYIQSGHLQVTNEGLQLTLEGIEISNTVISDLMKTD
jgi:oxygen-independent coproporphyrinogen-3 oxidase